MIFGKKKKVLFKIEGMHCEKCVAKVNTAIKELGGSAVIDLKLGRAEVTLPEKIDEMLVCEAVEKLGFKCTAV